MIKKKKKVKYVRKNCGEFYEHMQLLHKLTYKYVNITLFPLFSLDITITIVILRYYYYCIIIIQLLLLYPRIHPLISETQDGKERRREAERERERERKMTETSIGCLLRLPWPTDQTCYIGMCPDQELNLWPFGLQGDASKTEPYPPGLDIF